MTNQITIVTKDFLLALERLQPQVSVGKKTKKMKTIVDSQDAYISFENDNAVFATNLIKTYSPVISAKWEGSAIINFRTLLTFLKAIPVKDEIVILYEDGKIKIDTLKLSAKFTESIPWKSSKER
jgi:hypothetical protein